MQKANNYVTWEKLKNTLYHEDGSLRDIYIRDTNTAEKTVSQYVGKPVELTEENCQIPEEVLMVIDGEQVFFTKQLS